MKVYLCGLNQVKEFESKHQPCPYISSYETRGLVIVHFGPESQYPDRYSYNTLILHSKQPLLKFNQHYLPS